MSQPTQRGEKGTRHWLGPAGHMAVRSVFHLITAPKQSYWAHSEDEDLGSEPTSSLGSHCQSPKQERALLKTAVWVHQVKDADTCLSFFLNLDQVNT